MILATIFIMALQPSWSSTQQVYADLSKQLGLGRFNTVVDQQGNLTSCTITKSTGDAELDRSFCEIVRACLTPGRADMAATGKCMNTRHEQFLRALAAQRSAEGRKKNR